MIIFGWLVLGLVLLGEALTIAAFADWGWHHGNGWRWALALVLAALTMIGWWMFASPGPRSALACCATCSRSA